MDRDRVVFNYSHQGTARPVRKRPRSEWSSERKDGESASSSASDPRSAARPPNNQRSDIPRPPPPPVLSRHHSSDSGSSGRTSPHSRSSPLSSPPTTHRIIPHPPPPPSISGRSGSTGSGRSQSPRQVSPGLAEDPRITRTINTNQGRDRHIERLHHGGLPNAQSPTKTTTLDSSNFRVPLPTAPLPPACVLTAEYNLDEDDDDTASVDTSITRPVIFTRRKAVPDKKGCEPNETLLRSEKSSTDQSKNITSNFPSPPPPTLGLFELTDDEDDDAASVATVNTLSTIKPTNITPPSAAPHLVPAGALKTQQPTVQISVPGSRKRHFSGESTTSTVVATRNIQTKPKTESVRPTKNLLKNVLQQVLYKKDTIPSKTSNAVENIVKKEVDTQFLKTLGPIVVAKDPFTVADKPGTPEAIDWSTDHVELQWSAPISDGGTPIERYIIQKKDKIWEKATETIGPACKAIVRGLQEQQQYQFRIIAVNKAGESDPSDATQPIATKPRLLAPQIIDRIEEDLELPAGKLWKMDVKVAGEPPPTVVWHVNGNLLTAGKAVELDNSDYTAKLAIRPIKRGDSGLYSITVTNASGKDSRSFNVVVIDKPGKPEGPLTVSDVHKHGCKLQWKCPKDDGGCTIKYEIEKFETATGLWTSVGTSTTEPAVEITSLTSRTEYKFRVKTVNKMGASEYLATDMSVIAIDPYHEPGKSGNVKATDWDKDHVYLKWDKPADDGGSVITGYIVEKKDKRGVWEKTLEVSGSDTKATVPDLVEGQAYEFRVRAVNKAGPGEESDSVGPIIAKPRNLEPKIDCTNLTRLKIKAGESFGFDVKVIGEPPPDIKWILKGEELKSLDRVNVQKEDYLTKLAVKNSTRADSGTYSITASNVNGTDIADVEVIILDKPSSPNGPLKVSDVHADGCKLSWNSPSDDGGCPVENYMVEKMDETTGCWVPVCDSNGTTTTSNVDGLTPRHKYKFRVRAVNKQGESDKLTTDGFIEAKNPFDEPGKPKDLEVEGYGQDFVDLKWAKPDVDGGSPITGYIVEKRDKIHPHWEKCAEVEGDVTKTNVSDLTAENNNNVYEFRVRALNKAGPSEPSEMCEASLIIPEDNSMDVTEPSAASTSINPPETLSSTEASTSAEVVPVSKEHTTAMESDSLSIGQIIDKSPSVISPSIVNTSEASSTAIAMTTSSTTTTTTTTTTAANDYPVLRIPENVPEIVEIIEEGGDYPMVSIRNDLFSDGSSDGDESPETLEGTKSDSLSLEMKKIKKKLFSSLSKNFAEFQAVMDSDSKKTSLSGNQVFHEQLNTMLAICTGQCKILDEAQIQLFQFEKKEKPTTAFPSEDVLKSITIDQVAEYLKSLVLIDSVESERRSRLKAGPVDALSFIAHRVLRILFYHYNELQRRGREEGAAILSVDLLSKTCEGQQQYTDEHVTRVWDKVRLFEGEKDHDDLFYKRAVSLDHSRVGPQGFLKKVKAIVSKIQGERQKASSSSGLPPPNAQVVSTSTYPTFSPVTPPPSVPSPSLPHQSSQVNVRNPMYRMVPRPTQVQEQPRMQCLQNPVRTASAGHSNQSFHPQSVQVSQQQRLTSNLPTYPQQYVPNRQQGFPTQISQAQVQTGQQQFQQQRTSHSGVQSAAQVQRNLTAPVLQSQAQLQKHYAKTVQQHQGQPQSQTTWAAGQQQQLVHHQQRQQQTVSSQVLLQQQQQQQQTQQRQIQMHPQLVQNQGLRQQVSSTLQQSVQRPGSLSSPVDTSVSVSSMINTQGIAHQQQQQYQYLQVMHNPNQPSILRRVPAPGHVGQNSTVYNNPSNSTESQNLHIGCDEQNLLYRILQE